MKFSLEDKVVIITGASTGIGADLTRLCVGRGACVIMISRSRENMQTLIHQNSLPEEKVRVVAGDIREQETIDRAIQEAVHCWGRLDVLVNNAGFGVHGTFADVPMEVVRQNFETNFFAAAAFSKEVIPYFRELGEGMIVNVESLVALRAIPIHSCYSATKHALHGLSEAMRIELAPENIHVLSVCPGLIRTPFGRARIQIGPSTSPAPTWLYMESEKCAEVIIRAMEKRQKRIVITGHAKWIALLQRCSPELVDWIMATRLVSKNQDS